MRDVRERLHTLRGSAGQVVGYAGMLSRLTRDLPGFLGNTITFEQAAAILSQRLETRAERLLSIAERQIYGNPRSPHLRLLQGVGCELGDIKALVDREGVEGALAKLAQQGVYVAFDEFKGRREIIRGSLRFTATEEDFDRPSLAPHFERRSGGSRNRSTSIKTELAFAADVAPGHALALRTHNLEHADQALWWTAPLHQLLRYSKVGHPAVAWFYPLRALPWKVRATGVYLRAFGRLLGRRFPRPVWNDLQDPTRMAVWLRERLNQGRSMCLTTYASSAVRVAAAARERGISLAGVCFVAGGEPFPAAKRRVIEASGARVVVRYSSTETGTIGYSCAEPREPDDLHFFGDSLALIQSPREMGSPDVRVEAFLFTTLLATAPKILLNVENGDHGTLDWRECGCLLGALGLRQHIAHVRSHEKLTSEGMTFVKTRLLRVLDEVLPDKFGGIGADYQVLEEEQDGNGVLQLSLLVSPRLGVVDETTLKDTFLAELRRDNELERYMATIWERAGTIEVRRQPPLTTSGGKVLPFHLIKTRVP